VVRFFGTPFRFVSVDALPSLLIDALRQRERREADRGGFAVKVINHFGDEVMTVLGV
jgi:hypothetical protein